MKYQLVAHDAHSVDDFEQFIALEEALIGRIETTAFVDGHDFRSGEFNIFIPTDEPTLISGTVLSVAGSMGLQQRMRLAYRVTGTEDFTLLWPVDLNHFSIA